MPEYKYFIGIDISLNTLDIRFQCQFFIVDSFHFLQQKVTIYGFHVYKMVLL